MKEHTILRIYKILESNDKEMATYKKDEKQMAA